ncbi:MAG: histidine phosphatase family protein [Gammaproteobacteria bacterium]
MPLAGVAGAAAESLLPLLRDGGLVVAFRHALAPGTFDPPQFRVGDCSTQRNLNDEGRAQARRIGAWFRRHALVPAAVRSSPWCRCLDTAILAFGAADAWDALASPRQADEATRARRLGELRAALAALPAGRLEVWVTHQFVLSDLAGTSTASAEGLLLRGDGPRASVLGRLNPG